MTSNPAYVFSIVLIISLFNVYFALSPSQLSSIFIRMYYRDDNFEDVSLANATSLVPKIDNTKSTVLYVHGYNQNVQSRSVRELVKAYLKRGDHNVLALDYSKVANVSYILVTIICDDIGAAVARSLNEMKNAGLKTDSLHIIGHSMGGEVVGFIGRNVNFLVPRITGLDPAGPLFNVIMPHLSGTDAAYVDIIHTDYGLYGLAETTGTVDFFPNGGRRIQPGCPKNATFYSKEDVCSHKRSWMFYVESLITEDAFWSIQCPSMYSFQSGRCSNNKKALMGYGALNTNATGKYYLVTNSQYPFGLKEKGAEPA